MARSRKQALPAVVAGTEAQALAARMLTMQAEAGLTILMRMPMLVKGALGDRTGQREATKAVFGKSGGIAGGVIGGLVRGVLGGLFKGR